MNTTTVIATIHSDDHRLKAEFDCAPWLAAATDEEIADLWASDWSSCRAADRVALDIRPMPPEVNKLFDYCALADEGYEVSVNEDQAIAWLRRNRPAVAAGFDSPL